MSGIVKKNGKKSKGRQEKTEQRIKTMDQIRLFKKASMRAGTKRVILSSIVPARTWRGHALALPSNDRYNIRAQIVSTAGIKEPRR